MDRGLFQRGKIQRLQVDTLGGLEEELALDLGFPGDLPPEGIPAERFPVGVSLPAAGVVNEVDQGIGGFGPVKRRPVAHIANTVLVEEPGGVVTETVVEAGKPARGDVSEGRGARPFIS